MVDFRLYAISDRRLVADLPAFVREASAVGLRAFQFREKDLTAREALALAKDIRSSFGGKFFINDRTDIASAADANGVHLPETSWSAKRLKESFQNLLCGASAHSLEAAQRAESEGADFIVFGPVFDTPSKQSLGIEAKGVGTLKGIVGSIQIPVFAVGGITPERARQCREAGAHGVAVIRDLLTAKNIRERLSEYEEALGSL